MTYTHSILPPKIVPIHYEQRSSPSLPKPHKSDFITTSQLYEAVYENAFHPMYIGNGNAKMIKFNEKFSKLFEVSLYEIDDIKPLDLFETNDESFIAFINQRKEKGIAKAEVTCIKKSGERFPCRISSVIYESDKGEKRSMNTLVNISNHFTARWSIGG
jgi:PAS domain S-box-containing protein